MEGLCAKKSCRISSSKSPSCSLKKKKLLRPSQHMPSTETQLYCPREVVSPRGMSKNSRSVSTANTWQTHGTASSSSAPLLPARKAPPPQKKARDAAKPVAFAEERQPPDPNELICFPDGYDAPLFFSCVCLLASMARSVNCLGRKNAVQGPFNWGEAHCAGEKVKRKIGPFQWKSL